MLVPRSFRYSSSPPTATDSSNEKLWSSGAQRGGHGGMGRKSSHLALRRPSHPDIRPEIPARAVTEPTSTPSRPVAVPVPERSPVGSPQTMPAAPSSRASSLPRRKTSYPTSHRSDSLPPSVAALLAVTEIPRPTPRQFRRNPKRTRRISIDELVNEWKNDETLMPSYSSSPSLSILLEDASDFEDETPPGRESAVEGSDYLHTRTRSSESIPALDADDGSVTSAGDPSTPGSLRSRKSSSNLRKEKIRSPPSGLDHAHDHPLMARSLAQEDDENEDAFTFSASTSRTPTPKPKSSFKSNLTSSLHALKNAALSSFTSFTLGSSNPPSQMSPSSPWSDEMLWSHPFVFPRFSSEMRPAYQGTPTEAQRRYLNPLPLTFEEQEAPFQQALHAPYLAEQQSEDAPTIQMQTYSRARRRGGNSARRSGVDPQSEAGRALARESGMRQREPRENSDFLRVVVLEMNMRREGKLEAGRARIWLPPRVECAQAEPLGRRVPRRWVGVSAE